MKKNIILGAHVSTAGGFDKAIDRALEIEANCAQIFTKSNRQWKAKKISDVDAKTFIDKQQFSSVKTVVAHAAYLINLGSKNDETVEKSIQALAEELQRCEILNIPYLVLHPGTHRFTDDEKKSLAFIAEQVDKSFVASNTQNVTLLLETMAGQGNVTGAFLEQLGSIIGSSKNNHRIGVCFDTCHAFAAGYEFHTPKLYKSMWENFDQHIGIEKLKVFHMNDSQKELGTRVDRHENIGKGKIPLESFKLIMNDSRFTTIAKILETPKGEDQLKNDKYNMKTLIDLL